MQQYGPVISQFDLQNHGLSNLGTVYWNLSPTALIEHAIKREEGYLAQGGAFLTLTGEHTGRSPKDKFIVRDLLTQDTVNWGPVNQAIDEKYFDLLLSKVQAYYQGTTLFVQDCYAGSVKNHRLNVRVVTETAWHNMFAHNMFIQPTPKEQSSFKPDFTVLHAPGLKAEGQKDGVNSDVAIVISFTKKTVLILGTWYAGEIKKSIFSVLNHLLPDQNVMPMHCSANVGKKKDTAIFFGLSGTGKTTLSADPKRALIGDDEHGWSQDGVYNFEGGCYAKLIKLSEKFEPQIYQATQRFGTLLENVSMDLKTRTLNFDSSKYTENTRASYPLEFIENRIEKGFGGHPKNIIMLTCDAFGVLPPLSRLSTAQAMYHFLSGYTSKVAGTEKGLKEPTATFSTCFGAPFMSRHPRVYANILKNMMNQNDVTCWLLNTGWSGGSYGTGSRISIQHTRTLLNMALEGQLNDVTYATDPFFGLSYPTQCPDLPENILNPQESWPDKKAYEKTALNVVSLFEKNFKQFEDELDDDVKKVCVRKQSKAS